MSKCPNRFWVSYVSESEMRVLYADHLFGCIPSSLEKVSKLVISDPGKMYFCDVGALAVINKHYPALIDLIEAMSESRTKTWNPLKRWSYSKISKLSRLDKIAVQALIDRGIRWPPIWDIKHNRLRELTLREWIKWLKSLDGRYPHDMRHDWLCENL